jgi:hypothetical protein
MILPAPTGFEAGRSTGMQVPPLLGGLVGDSVKVDLIERH